MNPKSQIRSTPFLGVAVGILAMIFTTAAWAAAPPLQGQITLRPLTPQEIYDYGLAGVQGASGLTTTAVGQPVYLEVLVNNAVPNSDITNVTWTLTARRRVRRGAGSQSAGNQRADLQDRRSHQPEWRSGVQGRRPDDAPPGHRRVLHGKRQHPDSLERNTNLTQRITASTYLGVNASCVLCHSGASLLRTDTPTGSRRRMRTRSRTRSAGEHAITLPRDLPYRTVGFDGNTNANSSGFDFAATTNGWTFPATLTSNNWAAMPEGLKNLANVQCENCHGPGYQHVFGSPPVLGNTNFISVSVNAGTCAQCHDSRTTHALATRWNTKATEWANSLHAHSTRTPSGPGREACVRCHTTYGFIAFTTTGKPDQLKHRLRGHHLFGLP
jgi:hypothetical protein